MAFLVGGANSAAADTGYDISNSVRFDGAAANGLARFGNNSRDGKTFTISFWIKRTELGAVQQLVNSKVEDSGANSFLTTINSTDQLAVSGTFTSAENQTNFLITNNLLRDVSAWYHIVFRSDTTQSGETDRFKFYINGTEASYATDNRANISQDDTWSLFYNTSSYPYAISNDERDNVYGDYYMAEHHYCDGVSNAASAFGETDEDSGIWKPKKYAGSHGTYGHFLEFKNSGAGSGTTAIGGHDYTTGSSSTIGADTSGNDNHFHVQGYATTDQTTDTPTNNFCTMNPLDNYYSAFTFSEGNCKFLTDGADTAYNTATIGDLKKGKWYLEVKYTDPSHTGDGDAAGEFYGEIAVIGQKMADTSTDLYPSSQQHNFAYSANNGRIKSNNTAGTVHGDSISADGQIIGFLIDLDNDRVTTHLNGQYADGSGNHDESSPTAYVSITDPASTPLGGYMIGFGESVSSSESGNQNTGTYEINFGNPSFSISSGNADANGYGNFEYAVPSGYYALCTKNLAEFG